MQNLQYPVKLVFNIGTIANDFTAYDAHDQTVAYVRQKMFKLKEAITVYSDENKTRTLYTIAANKWLDWSAAYAMSDALGKRIGKVARKGWASIWKAEYEIIDQRDQLQYHIREESALVKVMDSVLGEIPFIGMLTGYFFNPTYIITDKRDQVIARLKKEPSFWGRKFEIEKIREFDTDDGERIMLSLMMMILLERRRG